MGEAFTAMPDDITSFAYNPANLRSLSQTQASFLYKKGLADDTYGRLTMGSSFDRGSLGVSLGYLDAGKMDLFDGVTTRTVSAKKDMIAMIGAAESSAGSHSA